MSMNSTTLAADMRSRLLADPESGAIDNDALTAFCAAVSAAVVEHLKASAEVDPTTGSPAMTAGGDAVAGRGRII